MQKILILAAVPDRLRLDREIRVIEEAIKRSVKRDSFDIRIRVAVRTQDIRRTLAEERPQIVHFCGHGIEDGSLVLEDDEGNYKPVSPEGLAALFKLHIHYVKCVLLNACYSSKAAEAISQHINMVIGMNQPIEDKAAIEFARGFYDGLGYQILDNQDVIQRAFDEGIVAIQLEKCSQVSTIPILWKSDISKRKSEPIVQVIPVSKNDGSNFYYPHDEQKVLIEPSKQQDYRIIENYEKTVISVRNNLQIQQDDLGDDDLRSERGVDYTQLRYFLKEQKWQDADRETIKVMCQVISREEGYLSSEEMKKIPRLDLRTINLLWVKYSGGHFGFSVQKQIWRVSGGKVDAETEKRLSIRVGWIVNGQYLENFNYSLDALKGHLPSIVGSRYGGTTLLSRKDL